MIEANPRLTVTGDATYYVGVDAVWLNYLDLMEMDVNPVEPNDRDVRHIVLRRDFQAIRSPLAAKRQLSWMQLARSYKPPVGFYDFSLREWRSSLGTLEYSLRVFLGPILKRLLPRRTG